MNMKWLPETIRAESEALPVVPLRVTRRPYRYRALGRTFDGNTPNGVGAVFADRETGESHESNVTLERRAFLRRNREAFGSN